MIKRIVEALLAGYRKEKGKERPKAFACCNQISFFPLLSLPLRSSSDLLLETLMHFSNDGEKTLNVIFLDVR